MSVELLSECKKKLLNSVSRIDKILQTYDSAPLQKCLQETCKSESVLKQTKEIFVKQRTDYQRSAQRIKEIVDKIHSSIHK